MIGQCRLLAWSQEFELTKSAYRIVIFKAALTHQMPLFLIFWNCWMLTPRPRAADRLTNRLPTGWKVCHFENRRIESHNRLQANKPGISHRCICSADELPAVIISIV